MIEETHSDQEHLPSTERLNEPERGDGGDGVDGRKHTAEDERQLGVEPDRLLEEDLRGCAKDEISNIEMIVGGKRTTVL